MLDLDKIATEILDNLRDNATRIVSARSLSSPRAIGDAVQSFIAEESLPAALAKLSISSTDDFSRRAMEDVAFTDADGNYYAVDVKTHNTATSFNMPNLISVKRLATFYRNDDRNNFCILIVEYHVDGDHLAYTGCHFKRIESFDWECLTVGALGWGQVQIANAGKLKFCPSPDRRRWMLDLCDRLDIFYNEEICKIGERKSWFGACRTYWKNHK